MAKILLLSNKNSAFSRQLGVYLEAEGFCVEPPQADSEKWVDDILTQKPDVLLMEIVNSNYLERYQFCQQLRQNPETENVPILLIGTDSEDGLDKISNHTLLEGLHCGANDYLIAPYNMAELVAKINVAIRVKNALEKVQVLAVQINNVNEELYQRNILVEKELHMARQLQHSLLPRACKLPEEEGDFGPMYTKVHYLDDKLRISGIYLPCDALGGDLYDVIKLPNNQLGVSITDVSGHGVPAGFITAIFKTSLYRITQQQTDPAKVMYQLNNELYDIIKNGDYVTSNYINLDLNTMTLESSGAGHPYPFYYEAKTGTMSRLKENGTPLVWMRDAEYPKDTVQLASGDKIFMFTDGISELRNLNQEMFGEERIEKTLMSSIQGGEAYLTDMLIGLLSDFTEGAPIEDDITMVLIEAL